MGALGTKLPLSAAPFDPLVDRGMSLPDVHALDRPDAWRRKALVARAMEPAQLFFNDDCQRYVAAGAGLQESECA